MEVGTRGFVVSSTTRLLRNIGLRGESVTQATIELSKKAENPSFWLWKGDRIR